MSVLYTEGKDRQDSPLVMLNCRLEFSFLPQDMEGLGRSDKTLSLQVSEGLPTRLVLALKSPLPGRLWKCTAGQQLLHQCPLGSSVPAQDAGKLLLPVLFLQGTYP